MDLNDKISLTKELLYKREEIDEQLATLLSGEVKKKQVKCSTCSETGHTARNCPTKTEAELPSLP